MPPRAQTPVGIVLLDKPPGPSSFALVAELRRRTRARTGHAGTLDPFATGLLVCLSGAATRLAPCFVGLDKRYLTTVDLTATTSTGDPEGEVVERHEPPTAAELDALLDGLRGEIELPVPAASAVKIGGERAYRLARRGVAVEMPLRRSTVHSLELVAAGEGRAELRLHVSSGTYVRVARRRPRRALREPPAHRRRPVRRRGGRPGAPARGGGGARAAPAGGARARPRTAAGPGPRPRGGGGARGHARPGWGGMNVARSPAELERRPRAVAIGTFDGVHVGHRAVVAAAVEAGLTPTVVTFDPHPREVLGYDVSLLSTLERRLELLAELGVADTLVVEFTPTVAALAPEAFLRVVRARDRCRGAGGRRVVPLRPRADG